MLFRSELAAATKGELRYAKRLWQDVPFQAIPMQPTGLGPYGNSYDLFGDGTFVLIDAKGHTRGNCIAQIGGADNFILLTGDCGYAPSSWEDLRLPGPVSDTDQMTTSLKWVQQTAHDPHCQGVFATHDPAILPQVITLPYTPTTTSTREE